MDSSLQAAVLQPGCWSMCRRVEGKLHPHTTCCSLSGHPAVNQAVGTANSSRCQLAAGEGSAAAGLDENVEGQGGLYVYLPVTGAKGVWTTAR